MKIRDESDGFVTVTFGSLTIREAKRLIDDIVPQGHEALEQPEIQEPVSDMGWAKANQPQKPRRRRRTKAEMEEARAAEAESNKFEEDVQAAAQEVQEEIDAAEPAPRRRRKGAPEPDTQAEDDPARRRRRRSAPAEDPTTAPTAGRKRRSRRGNGSSTDADESPVDSPTPVDSEITDRDVSKAASEGAQEIGPKAVRGILDQFGVSNVADLDQGQRREFIGLIDDAIEDASKAGD